MPSAVLLGATLAFDLKEPELMSRMPEESILSQALMWRTLRAGGFALSAPTPLAFRTTGVETRSARGAAVNVMVPGPARHLLRGRSFDVRWRTSAGEAALGTGAESSR